MLNVNIIEGEYDTLDDDYEQIKADYLNMNIRVVDIQKKYGISSFKWSRILKKIVSDTGFKRNGSETAKKFPNGERFGAKYYYLDDDSYRVRKYIDGKYVFFGRYFTEDEAKVMVRLLKECGWDKNRLEELQLKMEEELYD